MRGGCKGWPERWSWLPFQPDLLEAREDGGASCGSAQGGSDMRLPEKKR